MHLCNNHCRLLLSVLFISKVLLLACRQMFNRELTGCITITFTFVQPHHLITKHQSMKLSNSAWFKIPTQMVETAIPCCKQSMQIIRLSYICLHLFIAPFIEPSAPFRGTSFQLSCCQGSIKMSRLSAVECSVVSVGELTLTFCSQLSLDCIFQRALSNLIR